MYLVSQAFYHFYRDQCDVPQSRHNISLDGKFTTHSNMHFLATETTRFVLRYYQCESGNTVLLSTGSGGSLEQLPILFPLLLSSMHVCAANKQMLVVPSYLVLLYKISAICARVVWGTISLMRTGRLLFGGRMLERI